MPTKAGRQTRDERHAAIWRGIGPAQRDWQRFVIGDIPPGESYEAETEAGKIARAAVEDWWRARGAKADD